MGISTSTFGKMPSYYIIHVYMPSEYNKDIKLKVGSKEYIKCFKKVIFSMLKDLEDKYQIKSIAIPLLGCGKTRDDSTIAPLLLLETLKEYTEYVDRLDDGKAKSLEVVNIYAYNHIEFKKLMKSVTLLYVR